MSLSDYWYSAHTTTTAHSNKHTAMTENAQQELLECLFNDAYEEWKKISILCLIEESYILVSDAARMEHFLDSLRNLIGRHLYSQSYSVVQQICVTMTSVLIARDDVVKSLSKSVHGVVTLFLSTIEKVRDAGVSEVEGTLCLCLEELELAYPGLLRDSIMTFYSCLTYDGSFVFQHYMLLISACLQQTSLSAVDPFPFESVCQLLKLPVVEQTPIADRHYSQIISSMLDYLPLSTVCCRGRVMDKISKNFVKRAASIKVFYYQNRNSLTCHDIVLFQSALIVFLLSGAEMTEMDQRVLVGSNLIGLALYAGSKQEENLLALEWIYNLLNESYSLHKPWLLPFNMVYSNLLCFPTVLDSIDMTVAKLKLFNCSMAIKRPSAGVTGVVMRCLTRLQRMIDHGICIKVGASLYRTLYWFYLTSDDSNISVQITKLLLTISVVYPRFIPCSLNFVSTLNKARKSTLPSDLLMSMLQQVNVTKKLPYLDYHLMVIQQAAEIGIPEDLLIAMLLKIVKFSSICLDGDWSMGNQLLFTCQSVMVRVGKGQQFQDMDAVLMEIAKNYNDPDISDRAWFYHMLMHTLSSQKLMQVLNMDSRGSPVSLSRIVEAEITGTSLAVEPIETVGQNVLLLSRDISVSSTSMQSSRSVDSSDSSNMQQYQSNFSAAQMTLTVKCFVKFSPYEEKQVEIPSEIFSLNLKFVSAIEPLIEIPDVFIPRLNSSEGEKGFRILLCPKQPLPTTLHARAAFCGSDGRVYTASLNSLAIDFSDYFVKLQVAETFTMMTMKELFKNIWMSITDNQYSGVAKGTESGGAVSQFNLPIAWDRAEWLAREVLGDYVVDQEDGCIRFMILLPNHFHLLLVWSCGEQGTVVTMATDAWFALEYIAQWFKEIQ